MVAMPSRKSPYYPLFLDMEGRRAYVAGGGAVAARKVETLLRCGARVTVVSPAVTPELESLSADGLIELRLRKYEESDLEGAVIAFASTNDTTVNESIARDCRERGIPVNVADVTPLCDFILPAIVEQGSITVAISTGGHSPALARLLKADLQQFLGSEYAEVNDLLGELRDPAKTALPTDARRRQFFEAVLGSGVLDLLREGRRNDAFAAVERVCAADGVPAAEILERRKRKPDVAELTHGE